MDVILLVLLVGLAGGVAVGLQGPLASLLTQRLGVFESVFIVHLGGALLSLLPLLALGGGRLGLWRTAPPYALGAGVFGVVVLAAVSYTIPRVGVSATVTTIIAGQIMVSAILDHFGLLGAALRPLDTARAFGLGVVILGVWLTLR
jgi:transporter family-2 protein